MKARKVFFILLIVAIFFLPKGLLIPTNAEGVSFEDSIISTTSCPFRIHATYIPANFSHVFRIFVNDTLVANYILPGMNKGSICTPEGILLYAYFLEGGRGRTSMIFLDHNLNIKWWRPFSAYPLKYTKDGMILVSSAPFGSGGESCAYLMNISTGETTFRFCPDVLGAHISDVRIIGDKAYVTVGWPDRGWSSLKTKVILYIVEGKKVKRKTITSINGEGLGIRVRVDADDSHVAVAYYLKNEKGKEKNGVCIYTAGHLIKIACKSFNERPYDVKLDGNIVYIKTWNSVKAYKIIGP
ncbi:hypothetical protein [Thermococcus sp. GR6]|uniref:hypothetical protein n=1 Tax=Thermococcus sp. GR6 TaxID=1638256 RepID=UPI00143032FB|nr:hypothetical protein [Thermococcus sp. GR6]NJE42557.1 hypothetical protein [Thermococcus sp. GR6]